MALDLKHGRATFSGLLRAPPPSVSTPIRRSTSFGAEFGLAALYSVSSPRRAAVDDSSSKSREAAGLAAIVAYTV
jgi:hypothetical protein